MDPTATLAEIRRLCVKARRLEREDRSLPPDDADRLVELNIALDGWLGDGAGFLPMQWRHVRPDGQSCGRCG